MKKDELPKIIPVFPLSNFIIFPETSVPLNIFEPRYIKMIDDSMKNGKLIGMIQPKKNKEELIPNLHDVGCLGKITNFVEGEGGRYLVELKGIVRFKIVKEITNNKPYRECKINYDGFEEDLFPIKKQLKFSDLELIFKDLKRLFDRKGFVLNWKALEEQSLDETINALSMASPFSLEEKQVLLETKNLDMRKTKIAEILSTYTFDSLDNTTLQ